MVVPPHVGSLWISIWSRGTTWSLLTAASSALHLVFLTPITCCPLLSCIVCWLLAVLTALHRFLIIQTFLNFVKWPPFRLTVNIYIGWSTWVYSTLIMTSLAIFSSPGLLIAWVVDSWWVKVYSFLISLQWDLKAQWRLAKFTMHYMTGYSESPSGAEVTSYNAEPIASRIQCRFPVTSCPFIILWHVDC